MPQVSSHIFRADTTMVNPLHFFAAGGELLRRQVYSSWSTVVSTSFLYVTEPTSVTVFGYYTTYLSAIGSALVTTTYNSTTSTAITLATSPLTSTSAVNPACLTRYAAYNEELDYASGPTPVFQVGYSLSCLPTGYGTVAYYSPGLCPGGYTLASRYTVAASNSIGNYLETVGFCCFE